MYFFFALTDPSGGVWAILWGEAHLSLPDVHLKKRPQVTYSDLTVAKNLEHGT